MFVIDTESKTITLHRGDTGVVPYKLRGYTFSNADRVLYTIKDTFGQEVFQEIYEIDEDGMFRVEFPNGMTDSLSPGTYRYDARVAILPVYDDQGNIIDVDYDHGGAVITPESPLTIVILDTVGQI